MGVYVSESHYLLLYIPPLYVSACVCVCDGCREFYRWLIKAADCNEATETGYGEKGRDEEKEIKGRMENRKK